MPKNDNMSEATKASSPESSRQTARPCKPTCLSMRSFTDLVSMTWTDEAKKLELRGKRGSELMRWLCGFLCSQRCWHSGSYSRAARVTDPLDSSPIRWCMSPTSFSRTTDSNVGWHTAGVHSNQRLHPFVLGIQCSLKMCLKGLCDALR